MIKIGFNSTSSSWFCSYTLSKPIGRDLSRTAVIIERSKKCHKREARVWNEKLYMVRVVYNIIKKGYHWSHPIKVGKRTYSVL